MKNLKSIFPVFLIVLLMNIFSANQIQAQKANFKEVTILTSAVCEMCKETIEKKLAFEKGVKTAVLDVETKQVTVKYNPEKTNVENIKAAINKAGYDAEDLPADPKAYERLHECCKKDSHK